MGAQYRRGISHVNRGIFTLASKGRMRPTPPRPPVPAPPAPAPASAPATPRLPPSGPRIGSAPTIAPDRATALGMPRPVPPAPPSERNPSSVSVRVATAAFGSATGEPLALTRSCTSCGERYPADFLVCPRDATPLVDEAKEVAEDPLVGALVGETYQIVRVIGEGGMGRVYEARHLRLKERRFALKTLHADLAKNREMAARFLREAESASSIAHPNVIDVFDVHHLPDGTPYLVGEFLEGEELATYVKGQGPLRPALASAVVRQICSALGAAHARGIVHRDMKPENVFVLRASKGRLHGGNAEGAELFVKVLDFGISKAGGAAGEAHLTRTGVVMGTPSYMAPEQARGRDVDLRADVYSVGAVLYYALTGRKPFDADDPTATLTLVLTQEPKRPRELDAKIPEALELVVQRAMAKDPRDRYQSMAELEQALLAFEHGSRPAGFDARADVAIQVADDELPSAGAPRAIDIARSLLGAHSIPPPAAAHGALAARPTVVVASVVLGGFLVGGLAAALAGLVRIFNGGDITLTECLLLVAGCVFAGATPALLYVLHVRNVVWPNSVRAVQLAGDLQRTVVAALVTYGALAAATRILMTVIVRRSGGLASGALDLVYFVLALVVAGAFGGLGPLLRTLRRRKNG